MNSKLYLTTLVLSALFAVGCNSKSSEQRAAEEHAAKIDEAMTQSAESLLPGVKRGTMPEGCYLRAVVDGKKWEAIEMTPDLSGLSIMTVNGNSGHGSITFVISSKRDNIGQPSNLSDSNQITFWGGDDFFVGAKSGQFTVTKMDDKFIDGTFNFTAEKDGRTITATDGEFRVPAPPVKPEG